MAFESEPTGEDENPHTGLAAALLGLDTAIGTFRGNCSKPSFTRIAREQRMKDFRFHHFRDRDGYEVDLVIEQGARRIAGIEVKSAASTVNSHLPPGNDSLRESCCTTAKAVPASEIRFMPCPFGNSGNGHQIDAYAPQGQATRRRSPPVTRRYPTRPGRSCTTRLMPLTPQGKHTGGSSSKRLFKPTEIVQPSPDTAGI